jgi:stress-induced morphogen
MGTPGYMSPEQAQGADAVRPERDVFALGVILYEILSGQRPFAGKSPLDVKNEVLFHEPPAPLTLNARAGRELSAICMKAIHKDPARRYLSARELAADLRRFREFRPVSVVEPRLVERVVLWARRHGVLAAALGTLLAAVVVAAGFAGVQRYVEHRVVSRVLVTVEEGYAEVQSLEREVSAAREELARLPAGSTAHAAAVEEERDSRARLATAHLQLRGRLAAVIGFTLGSPHPRAVELGRWQSLRLVELMLELDNEPMARALARSTLEQVERNNVLQLTAADVARLREVAGSGQR